MLINCPRCGFSQPKDQYCAQCGVDMQSFKPKEAPALTRLLQNTTFQIVVLLLAAGLVGQSIIRREEPQKWVQKMTHFQGMNKAKDRSGQNNSGDEAEDSSSNPNLKTQETTAASKAEQLDSLRNKEFNLARSDASANAAGGAGVAGSASANSGAQDLSSLSFKLTYAEVSTEMLTKWINESSNLGLYQNLPEYSAGIIYDFRKRGENFHQILKSADIKLNLGSSNSNISGTMTEDGAQVLGLIAAIEYKSNDNESIHGSINISKNSRQGTESYPAEFDLSKGAAFFIIGTVKRENFVNERSKLVMPPFQIFKSPDFMTRKTEFVIIVEPDYK